VLIEIRLHRNGATPLYRQVRDAIRDAIHGGRLTAGSRLPSTRDLARDLSVSRNTVAAAFDQLAAEGYLVSRAGRGTRVTDVPATMRPRRNPDAPDASGPISRVATAVRQLPNALPGATSPRHTFSLGLPPLEVFPAETWGRLLGRHARELRGTPAPLLNPAGLPALREAIARHYATARGIRCDPEHVIIVRGTQHALDLVARTVTDPGMRVAVEDPGFPGTRGAFTAAGARLVPIVVDHDGMRVEALRALARPARVVVVTPAHQFPTGSQLSLERRVALLDWARTTRSWVIEDDYDSEFRYAGEPLATLRALDERVIYLGTFSKTLVPALRLGFIIAPPGLAASIVGLRVHTDLGPSYLDQAALADFITEGHLARHVRQLRHVVRARRACLLEVGSRELRNLLALQEDETGLHLVGWLADGLSATAAANAARRKQLDVTPLSFFRHQAPVPPALVLGFGAAREPDIAAAVRQLRRVLEGLRHR
jgi:GntR family transcriptional regulator/MocR family aminotransferase